MSAISIEEGLSSSFCRLGEAKESELDWMMCLSGWDRRRTRW